MIEVSNIVKCYTDKPVLKGISFTIQENGVYGFLGPNGAGKSTTMNIITGCLSATEGSVRVGGYDIYEEPEKAKRLIGYLPELPPVYPEMSPYEYLSFVGRARGVPKNELKDQVNHAMDVTGLLPVQNRLIKFLSKGYRQRVGISETLLGDPAVIILDEPTVGLDPKQITEIRELVRSLGKDHIVLFSSHIMQEVQAISDEVMIIARGELLIRCKPEELEQRLRKKPVLMVRVKADRQTAEELLSHTQYAESIDWLKDEGEVCEFSLETEETDPAAEELFNIFAAAGRPILRLEHHAMTLEEAFLELTQDLDTYGEERAMGTMV